jgi:hypothetical protein
MRNSPKANVAAGLCFATILSLAGVVTVVAGCGSGSGTSTGLATAERGGGTPASSTSATSTVTAAAPTGRSQITVLWPERGAKTRLIPFAANSIRVNFRSGANIVQTQLLSRPAPADGPTTSTANFTNLPQGTYTVEAIAYPTTDGTGTAQAQAQGNFNIIAGQANPIGLSMATTIARVTMLPEQIPVTTQPVELTAAAFDAQNNLVVTNQWEWTNTNNAVVTLTPQGDKAILQLVGPGTTTIQVRETESNKSAFQDFVVAPQPSPSGSASAISLQQLQGTWQVASHQRSGSGPAPCPTQDVCGSGDTITFESNGAVTENGLFWTHPNDTGMSLVGSYTLSGNQLTTSVNVGQQEGSFLDTTYTVVSYDGTTLTLSRPIGDGLSEVITLVRSILV